MVSAFSVDDDEILKAQMFYEKLVENGFEEFVSETLLMDLTLKINGILVNAKNQV